MKGPVYAVLGNHDWWLDGERVTAALAAQGIVVLENSAIEAKGVWLAGIADEMTRRPDVARALSMVPNGAPVIAMMHNPDVFATMPACIGLTVAGHTHGG